jgi:hypothetical protein
MDNHSKNYMVAFNGLWVQEDVVKRKATADVVQCVLSQPLTEGGRPLCQGG